MSQTQEKLSEGEAIPKLKFGQAKVLQGVNQTITGALYYDNLRLLCFDYGVRLDVLIELGFLEKRIAYWITDLGRAALARWEEENQK